MTEYGEDYENLSEKQGIKMGGMAEYGDEWGEYGNNKNT